MNTVWIRVTYAAALALLLSLTVVFGISMVTPGPKPPQDPGFSFRDLQSNSDDQRSQTQVVNKIDTYYGEASQFRHEYTGYQRNVFLAASGIGVVLLLIGVGLPAVVNYLRLGFVGSSVLLFAYAFYMGTRPVPTVALQVDSLLNVLSLGTSGPLQPLNFAGRFARFAVCFIGLILALFLGIWRLTEWRPAQRRVAAPQPSQPGFAYSPAQQPQYQPQYQPQPAMAAAPAGASQWAPPPAPVAPPPPQPSTAAEASSVAPPPVTSSPPANGESAAEASPPEWRRPE